MIRRIMVLVAVTLSLATRVAKADELVLWEQERTLDQQVLDELIALFQKDSAGVTVKRAHYRTEDLRAQFQTAALGKGGADLVLAPNDFAGPFAVMGIIQPVDSWAKLDRFYPAVVQAVKDAKGTWGMPISSGNHLMLFVNKKLAKKIPESLEEMVDMAKAFTNQEKKLYGLVYNLNEPFWFVPFMGAFGQQPLTGTTPNLDTPAMVDALALVKHLKFDEKIVPADCDYTCADTLFADRKAMMVINGDWAVQKYEDELKGDLAILPLPKIKAAGHYMTPLTSGKYLFLNKKLAGAKLDAAKKFSEFMVSEKVQEILIEKSKRIPVLTAMKDNKVLKSFPNMAASEQAMEHGTPMPMAVEMRAVWDAIRPQLQQVMAGKTEPKLAASLMQKDAETKIKEMKQ